jgi:subtilisin-like proprotein convertase family protein
MASAYRRQVNAVSRLLSKLPCTAAQLTSVERNQLRILEKAGRIKYVEQSGYWVTRLDIEAQDDIDFVALKLSLTEEERGTLAIYLDGPRVCWQFDRLSSTLKAAVDEFDHQQNVRKNPELRNK